MNILILNCDFDKNPETNGAHLIKSHLAGNDVAIKDVFENEFPDKSKISSYSHVIITGSRASVYDSAGWIKNLVDVVKTIDKDNTPTLGVCFGFQIIAEAFGGNIESSGHFEEGFKTVALTDSGKRHFLFSGFPQRFMAYQSHGDIATKLPDNAAILAKNGNSIQAYSLRNFHCVQFHPEILPETAIKMALRDGKNLNNIIGGVGSDYNLPVVLFSNFIEQAK